MKNPHCNTEQLEQGCGRLGIALSAGQGERLRRHVALLAKWNRRLNLTAIDPGDMLARHLLDSLAIAPFVRGGALLDIGSGGGFPGLPLAIVMPQLEVTLLDSRGKRAEFLRYARADLGLDNVNVVARRVEDYRPAGKFDTLATRAFASPGDPLTMPAGLHRRGCRLLAMTAKRPERELAGLAAAFPAFADLRARATVEKLEVPFLAAERHLIIIEL